jgi:hypothetical protein
LRTAPKEFGIGLTVNSQWQETVEFVVTHCGVRSGQSFNSTRFELSHTLLQHSILDTSLIESTLVWVDDGCQRRTSTRISNNWQGHLRGRESKGLPYGHQDLTTLPERSISSERLGLYSQGPRNIDLNHDQRTPHLRPERRSPDIQALPSRHQVCFL